MNTSTKLKRREILMADFQMPMPLVVVIDDLDSPTGIRLGELEYEQLVYQGNPEYAPESIDDEWDPITLNYTSGTTSEPKGVVYSLRCFFEHFEFDFGLGDGSNVVGYPLQHHYSRKSKGWGSTWSTPVKTTEATGPALVCEWQAKWNKLPWEDQAKLKARQGLGILTLADVDVKNFKTMQSVPRDGITTGEICLRGSSIMKGYLKNEK
ncbi:hypothetical protein HAX54_052756 [Datura stramonium]|uniref:AMP-dependent synthetase/ligase domain-containing protein n=1 Tax=Datura stramonium TaxID=4076 RepID=A0ABS8WSQ6_DATST|nr:hypothetical protein [Datura stramonium]